MHPIRQGCKGSIGVIERGEARGKEIGMKIGREEEKENTIKAIVSLYQKFKGKKEDAVDEVIEKCDLSKEAAQEKVNDYWE